MAFVIALLDLAEVLGAVGIVIGLYGLATRPF